MAIPQPLAQLVVTPGPTGHEEQVGKRWREWCREFAAEVDADSNGSSWARRSGTGAGAPTLAVVGHADEIGVHVTHIDEHGFLRFRGLGGWDPVNLVGQRVVIDTLAGPVRGVIGKKPIHLLDEEDRKAPVKLKALHLDIGAKDAAEAKSIVRIGDAGVIDVAPLELRNGRIVSRSLDNRVGCHVGARALELIAKAGGSPGDFIALAVVQEEIGYRGARTAAYRHRPDLAIVVDVTFATDTPGFELGEMTEHELGSGPVLSRGPAIHPKVFELLYQTAQDESIPVTLASEGTYTGTDADALYVSRAGIPTALVSVPLRYMHSPVEMIDPQDLEHAAQLIAAFAQRLDASTSFER